MKIIGVDRTNENHGKHNGTINLTYDEIVTISNALYLGSQTDNASDSERYERLHRNWRVLEHIVCHGDTTHLDVKE